MAEKILNSRIIQKHDVEENWLKATNFSPKQGEIIIYDTDENYNYERMKIGDGVTNVNDLPFVAEKEVISINTAITGKIVELKDATLLEHKIKVQLSNDKEGTLYFENASLNLIGGDLENGRTYTVSLCELQADGDEFKIEFENGEYAQFTIINEETIPAILPAGTKLSCESGKLYYAKIDYSSVKVTKYGKNLFDISKCITEPTNSAMCSFVDNNDGTYTFTKEGLYGHRTVDFPISIKANTSIMISVNLIETYSLNALLIYFKYADGTGGGEQFSYNGAPRLFTPKKDVVSAYLYVSQGTAAGSKIVMEKAQIEIGTTATEYEPPKAPEIYTPTEDGTVTGVTSYYPTTILIADNADVTITAEYIKNVNETLGITPSDDADSTLVVGANIFDVLRFTKQTLTDAQKAQVIENLGITYTDYTNYDKVIKSINHRGYNMQAPENTLPAFILSKQMGYNYVECDVRFTKDGVPVLLHDTTIDRTSNGSGNLLDFTFEELLQYDFGSWKSEEYVNVKIPTFE